MALAALAAPLRAEAAGASGTWTFHPSYDGEAARLFDTPEQVYLLSYAQTYRSDVPENSVPSSFLWRFDKETSEMAPVGRSSGLSHYVVALAEYNPAKRYLMLVYEDSQIDLLYDSGDVVNIPGLAAAGHLSERGVNSITFDPDNDLAYLATDFGYLAINDRRHEVSSSRIYNRRLQAVAVSDGRMLLADADGLLLHADANAPRTLWSDYTPIPGTEGTEVLIPLDGGRFGVLRNIRKTQTLHLADLSGAEPQLTQLRPATNYHQHLNNQGALIATGNRLLQLKRDGKFDMAYADADETYLHAASADFREFFFAPPGEGIYSRKAENGSSSTQWTTTRRNIVPEGPAPYLATALHWDPELGFMVSNHGLDQKFTSQALHNPLQLSALKDGHWTQFGLRHTQPSQLPVMSNPNGLAKADGEPYVYFGSLLNGLLRVNLENPADILHLSRPDERWENLPGFHKFHEVNPEWTSLSHFSAPQFDAQGNLWSLSSNHNSTPSATLVCWPDGKRQAKAYSAPAKLPVDGFPAEQPSILLPLRSAANKGLLVAAAGAYNDCLMVYDTNSTPTQQSDDRKTTIQVTPLTDVDGNSVEARRITCLFEDPRTGLVWVGHSTGLFTFNPRTALANSNPQFRRIKVSRNDGTSLADYLMENVDVLHITSDPRNRKWISTNGGGLVCVSEEGTQVLTENTTANSDIPSDVVYASVYSPELSSMMVATDRGLAEYRPYTRGDGTDFEQIRAYPNPVRPDFLGRVTIDGLADNALVKIVAADGRLVRELELAANGETTWDVRDLHRRRVGSGVYYVMASTSDDGSDLAKVAKILVVN